MVCIEATIYDVGGQGRGLRGQGGRGGQKEGRNREHLLFGIIMGRKDMLRDC